MSILIKGLEMPKDGCKDCIFVNRKWLGDVCQILKREVTGNVERGGFETGCPLVPVPPHGRLGDLDALMQHEVLLPRDGGHLPIVYASYVRNAPTIIPAEE